jgi:hypothetical protein
MTAAGRLDIAVVNWNKYSRSQLRPEEQLDKIRTIPLRPRPVHQRAIACLHRTG